MQVQQLVLGVHQAFPGIQRDDGLIFHPHFGAQRLEVDVIRIGHVLGRGLRPDFVGPPIGRVAGQVRRLHRDLGAGDDEVSDIERQLGQEHPERIEDRDRDNDRQRQRHRPRNRDAQHPHHPAVARCDGEARLHSGLIGWVL